MVVPGALGPDRRVQHVVVPERNLLGPMTHDREEGQICAYLSIFSGQISENYFTNVMQNSRDFEKSERLTDISRNSGKIH